MSGTVGLAARIDAVEHYQAVAALANMPMILDLLREARAALPAEFCGTADSLAGRIDAVANQATPRGEPVLGTLGDLVYESYGQGSAWFRR